VVGVENVARRLRQQRESGAEVSVMQVVTDATQEVRSPMGYATLIVLLAIVPVAVMEGRPGAFFEPMALAYALAAVAATVVALTLTPALSLMLFSRGTPGGAESPVVRRLAPRYDRGLSRFMRRPRTALIAAGACVLAVLVALPLMDSSVVPSFKDRDVLVRLDGDPGTSNPRMTQLATQVSRELRSIPGVDNVGAHVGRAVGSDQVGDVSSSEVWVSIDSGADYDKTLASIEDTVDRVRSARHDVVTYSTQKIRDVGALNEGENQVTGDGLDVLTGSDRPLAVRVFGQEQEILRRQAAKVQQVVAQVDGVSNPRIEQPAGQPNLEIQVDLAKARREGIKPGDVRRAEAALLQGIQVGSVFEDQKVFDVIVQGTPATRRTVAGVRNLLIDKPDGGQVRLGDVAEVRIAESPAVIRRDAVSRYLDIEADVSGRSVGDVANDIEGRLANVSLPLEYHAEVLQQTTAGEINTGRMLAFSLGCALAIFLLLQAGFGGWRLAVLAFVTVPVAFAGGAAAALIDGAELSLGSWIGFLALFGLATRNGMMLIRHFQRLERDEGQALGPDHVRRGAGDRFAAIATTAAALALVALPFVVMGTRPGLKVVQPMAVVILGGLVTTTFLSLFVLPALYLRYAVPATPGMAPEDELMHRWAGVGPEAAAAPAPAGGLGNGDALPAKTDGRPGVTGAEKETAS
jgi:Cu/Ag efflux pump CusA